ncbi:MAG TPA: TonB family protein [Thermoanaerobaculia bacterium]|nr:TonB family protein [Thermoanaerobaculia bacterium]
MAKKVLLIEYEQRDRNRVRSLLGSSEYDVTEAHDGEEGLEAFSAGEFDLVLLCGKLPRMSSSDVIREIRNKGGASAPPIVLLMAGYSGSNTKADAQKIGAFEIVAKPFADGSLLAAVQAATGAAEQAQKTAKAPAASRLTSTDIFSDLLDELGREAPAPAARPAAPRPAAPKPPGPPAGEDEMERRLRDTLSGVSLKTRPGVRPASPGVGAPPREPATPRTPAPAERDIDRMLTETLRIKVPKKAPPAPVAAADATPTPSRRVEPREAVAGEGPDRFGQYELLERIASGGMAEVFRARRTGVEGFQKIVAIKKILPHIADNDEFITMFADEAKLAAQLNHPNIVHIYDLGKIEAGGYFIAMEYVDGLDLRTILTSARDSDMPLPVPLAVYVAGKVASALDYAHRRKDARGEELKIVHRDVSPQNILISHEGEIKLCDFGIAKADRKVSKTESGSLKGKLQYMSPEQAWGKSIDLRSDLFSLGCVLHEMLTGERLFRGDSDMTVLELVRKADVGPPSRVNADVPAALDSVVAKALARDPEARYATGAEMLRDLETVLYSYTPAPGSADLAIYLNRLREAQAPAGARAGAVARAVTPAAPKPVAPAAAPPPASPKEATAAAAAGDASAPSEAGVFGSFSPSRLEFEKGKRLPLYIGIAAVVVIGGLLALFLGRKETPAAAETVAPPVATPLSVASSLPPVEPVPTPAVRANSLDPKGIEQEVQRQLAAKRDALQRATPDARPTSGPTRRPTIAPVVVPTEAPVAEPEPTEPPPPPTAPPPEPTPVVVARAEPPPPPAPAPAEPVVSRGDLVGPGPGVVEPALVAPPQIRYPPMARQQKVAGRVVVLVLVNENGTVSDARVQKGLGGRSGIDSIVLEAVRGSRFRPATKNGVPVRMWRTVVVDVKP